MDVAALKYGVAFLVCVPSDNGAGYTIVKMHGDPTTAYPCVICHDEDDLYDVLISSTNESMDISESNSTTFQKMCNSYLVKR